ncbi:hypothetical protein [Siminovitchia sp. 179-K 8D1 HS]|uniref:hypothetical protein n=1 Tax=Siminovitchia sp. 179-K 8D1 HS TaxID=3142385 RepID=UPI00399F12F1
MKDVCLLKVGDIIQFYGKEECPYLVANVDGEVFLMGLDGKSTLEYHAELETAEDLELVLAMEYPPFKVYSNKQLMINNKEK